MPNLLDAVVTVQQSITLQQLIERIMAERSGVYLVTIHQGEVKKIARVEREIILEQKG